MDIFFLASLITVIRSFDSRDRFGEFTAGRIGAAAAARLRASVRRATFRLKASSAAAAALAGAGFCAARVLDSTALRAAIAGLAALPREASMAVVFFSAAASLPRASLLEGVCLTASTGFGAAVRLAAVPRVTGGFPGRAASAAFFAALAVGFPDTKARVAAGAFFLFLAAGVETAWLLEREFTAADVLVLDIVFAFAFCADFLAASFLAASFLTASARTAAASLALIAADRFDAFALGLRIPGCFARFVSDDFIVFLTDAITSALLFPVPLWRRDGSSTADKLSAVRKLGISALERLEAGCS